MPYEQHHNQAKRDLMAGTGLWFSMMIGCSGGEVQVPSWDCRWWKEQAYVSSLHIVLHSHPLILGQVRSNNSSANAGNARIQNLSTSIAHGNLLSLHARNRTRFLRTLARQLSVRSSHETILEPVRTEDLVDLCSSFIVHDTDMDIFLPRSFICPRVSRDQRRQPA